MSSRPLALALIALVALVALAGTTAAPRAAAADDCRTFPETGKSVCGAFLAYWEAHGGLAQQGLPLTDAFDERSYTDGKVYRTQYFERARFEAHPDNAAPYDVLLGLVGREQYPARYPQGRPATTGTGDACFAETGRCIDPRFLAYWRSSGGLAQQGLPISDAFDEINPTDGKAYATQYFERARFEYHPDQAEPYRVLLGLLGGEQLLSRYAGLRPAVLREVYSTAFASPFPGTTRAVGTAAATYGASGPGRLRIAGDGSVALATVAVPGGAPLTDMRVETSVIQGGAGDSAFGLICRQSADGSSLKATVGGGRIVFAALAPVDAPYSGTIILDQPLLGDTLAPVGWMNSLRLDCVGDTMAMTLNGVRVAAVTGLTPRGGGFGLEAFVKDGSAIVVDNLLVTSVTPLP